jgi:hypothetical protein
MSKACLFASFAASQHPCAFSRSRAFGANISVTIASQFLAFVDEPQSLMDQQTGAIYTVLQRSNPFIIKGLSNALNQKNDIYGKTWHVYCN